MHDIQSLSRTRIKFCGITQLTDAKFAENLGVDALGFVFYEKSPRYLSATQAAVICEQLAPFTTKVGLFVNAGVEFINAVLKTVSLDLLQFHGDETESFCKQFAKPYVKAVQVQTQLDIANALINYPTASGLLLDSFHAEKRGGSGAAFDWHVIPKNCDKPLILAGGLNADNVAQAISVVKPYAVDVSSGIEFAPGKKDQEKMRAFVAAIKCSLEE